MASGDLFLRIFKRISKKMFVEIDQVRVLCVCLIIFDVVLIAQLNFFYRFGLLHSVFTSSCIDKIFLIFVVLLDFNLPVGVRHQLLRNLVVVNNFASVGLTVLSLYSPFVQLLKLPGTFVKSFWVDFRDFWFV